MTIGTIELAEQELALLEQIDFNWHSHDSGRRSCDAAARLKQGQGYSKTVVCA